MKNQDVNLLIEFYKNHEAIMLNHESQRSNMTNIIITMCTILFAVIGNLDVGIEKLFLSFLIPLLGLFGYYFSMKHYERFSWHLSCANAYRKKLHEMYPSTIIDRDDIKENLKERFGWIHRSRLYKYWSSIHLAILITGLLFLVIVCMQYFVSSKNI